MYRKIVFLLIAALLVLTGIRDAEANKGFYVGLGTAYNTIQGDFHGTSGLEGGSEVIILPKVGNAFGIDILTGYGINDQWAVELNLMSSGHSGNWSGMRGNVSFTSFSFNGKYSFTSSGRAQPYLLFGISNNALLIKKGAENTSTGEVGDATLSGAGINLGAGIDEYLSPNVSLNLGALYRFVEYTEASGVNRSGSIDNGIDGSGFSFLLLAEYHF